MSVSVFDYQPHTELLVKLFKQLEEVEPGTWQTKDYAKFIKKFPQSDGSLFSKDQLIQSYRELAGTHGLKPLDEKLIALIRMKPVRTLSGVTPITILTKPFPCPGKCIFCPNDIRMPKSYLHDEPGAQRAERNYFDPYLQTYNRLQALINIGHPIDKVEIIVLGGTWSFYPEAYQIWFIKEAFRALNEFGSSDDRSRIQQQYREMEEKLRAANEFALSDDPQKNESLAAKHQIQGDTLSSSYNRVISELYVAPERKAGFDAYQSASWSELEAEHQQNETAGSRCVGLVIETRPDNISEAEVLRIRRLGCTKTQIGVQSLQDTVLSKNHRGHDVAATRRAFQLLRQAGFKIHAHWMANLHGSNVSLDKSDYDQLFSDPDFCPDELKIYPCSLIDSAELMQFYQRGEWHPYSYPELLEVLEHCLVSTPEYCRLTRIIRDIPSTDIVVGNKLTNFRQIAQDSVSKSGQKSRNIRAREVRDSQYAADELSVVDTTYQTSVSIEHFLQFVTPDDKLAAFLRLSIPLQPSFIEELRGSAVIRELHVYGQAIEIGDRSQGAVQHLGLGTKLLQEAASVALKYGIEKLSVISAVGTREYYRKKGFIDGMLYQHKPVSSDFQRSTQQ